MKSTSKPAKHENCDEREEQAPHSYNAANTCANERTAISTTLSGEDITSDWGLMCLPGCPDDLEFYNYVISTIDKEVVVDNDCRHTREDEESPTQQEAQNNIDLGGSDQNTEIVQSSDKYNERKLLQMGLLTAVAIALHNFPEGLATFVAVLDNPSAGAVLAIAIAMHNVPEGLCVAIPVYYATGNRRKAFLWGALSGMSELFAAFFGWAVLSSSYSEALFGVLFGLVSGMMVSICIRELLPTAHRHDPRDDLVTKSFVVGMIVMGFSLVLFRL